MYNVFKRNIFVASLSLFSASAAYAAGNATTGAVVFQQCSACHSLKPGVNLVGPSLNRVVGRPAGGIAGYSYSPVMQEASRKGLVWTPENIVNYLENPHRFLGNFTGDPSAPNKMAFMLADRQQREDVVAYLQTIK